MVSRFKRAFHQCPPRRGTLVTALARLGTPRQPDDPWLLQSSRPTDAFGALSAPPAPNWQDQQEANGHPRFVACARKLVRNSNLRCCCQMGWFKEQPNSRVAIFRMSTSTDPQDEINEIRLWRTLFFSTGDALFAQPIHIPQRA